MAVLGHFAVLNFEDEVPLPKTVAAWTVLGLLRPEAVPMWAAWWLVEGYDGDGVRALAGLSGGDPLEVRDVLPDALADVGVSFPSVAEAARTSFDAIAAEVLAGRTTEEVVVKVIERVVVATGYDPAVWDQPLARTYGLDDEWGAGWGRSIAELRREVREACQRQLDQP